jgi:RNA polymerase sigma-70 factor (ECF subfamily)
MLRLAQRVLSRREVAEDILHEVFLEAWEHCASYDPARGTVRAWLILRTRSRCLDYRRAAQQSRTLNVGDEFWSEHSAQVQSDHEVSADAVAIRRRLLELPSEQRDALFLGYYEGLSSSEIAVRTNSPLGTVKTRVAAALSKLRTAISDEQGRAT